MPTVTELLLEYHLKELKIPFKAQVQFDPERKWRLDFLLTEHRIGIEIDGYFKGRHGAGWGADNEKRNAATMQGIRVLVFSTKDVLRGQAKAYLEHWLLGSPSPSCTKAVRSSQPKARVRVRVHAQAAK